MLKIKDRKWVVNNHWLLSLYGNSPTQSLKSLVKRHCNHFTYNMLPGHKIITINVVIKMLLLARLNGGSMVDWAPTRVEEGKSA